MHEVLVHDRQLDLDESSVTADQYTTPTTVKIIALMESVNVCGIMTIHLPVTVTHFCSGWGVE